METELRRLGLLPQWQTVLDGLRQGFDVGVSSPTKTTLFPNHASTELDSNFIDNYVAQECASGRYSRGFSPDELEAVIGPFRTSPLGLVPKAGSAKFRLIQDMSFPRHSDTTASVNEGVCSDDFPTAWGTFDEAVKMLLSLPDGAEAATFDIRAAYRVTPIRPDQQNALCLIWRGKVYIDRAVMFGLASSAGVFGAVADMIVAISLAHGFGPMCKWVDDFLVIRLPGQRWTEADFVQTTGMLGVPWAPEKTRPFAFRQRYLGFIWDLAQRTVELPQDKLDEIKAMLDLWTTSKDTFTARDCARLHGKLAHISSIFPLIRPFLRSMARLYSSFMTSRARLHIPHSVHQDLSWTLDLLTRLPNRLPLRQPEPLDVQWWGDASTSFGVGVTIGPFWGVWRWSDQLAIGPGLQYDIAWGEAIAVEIGLLMAEHHGLVAKAAATHARILVRSDNQAIVAVVNKGRSASENTNTVLRRLFRHCAHLRIALRADYVASGDNISDALSRGDIEGFLARFPHTRERTSVTLPHHLASLFASRSSRSTKSQ